MEKTNVTGTKRSARRRVRRPTYDWSAVDWTLQDSRIAELIGCKSCKVWCARRKLGKPKSPNHGKHADYIIRMSKFDWDSVDWLRQNYHIAKTLGCTHQRVSRKRAELGMLRSPTHHKRDPNIEPPYMAKARTLDFEALTAKQAAKTLGVGLSVIYTKFKGKTKRAMPFHDWNLVNPEACKKYSDKQLSEMIGCHKQMVVRKRIEKGIYRDGPRSVASTAELTTIVGRWIAKRGGTIN